MTALDNTAAFALSGWTTGLLSILLGGYAYHRRKNQPVTAVFFWMTTSIAWWAVCIANQITAAGVSEARFWAKVMHVGVILIGPTYFHFCVVLTQQVSRRTLPGIYITALALIAWNFLDGMVVSVSSKAGLNYYTDPGPGYPALLVYFGGCSLLGMRLLTRALAASTDSQRCRQIQYVLFPSIVGFLGGSATYLPVYGVPVWPYCPLLVAVFIPAVSYAILKHQLMGIRVVIQKTILHFPAMAAVSLIYLVAIYFLHEQFFFTSERRFALTNVAGIVLAATLIKPAEWLVRRLLQRMFFGGTFSEILERKELLEIEIERRERLKSVGILAAGMAHELKNPLTSIKTFVERLPEKYDDPVFREKFCRILGGEIGRMTAIVSDLLAFSKPAEPKREPCSLDRLLREILELIGPRLVSAGVKVEADLREATAFADKEQMRQALLNLLMNAVDSMAAGGGTLAVVSRQSNGRAEVEIKDQGCGMAPETLKHVFDPFFTTKEGGTGMGLAVTHSIVERNGGRITVQSALNQGTTFTLNLPA